MSAEPGPPGTPPEGCDGRRDRGRDIGAVVIGDGVAAENPADRIIDRDDPHALRLAVDRDLDAVGGLEREPSCCRARSGRCCGRPTAA